MKTLNESEVKLVHGGFGFSNSFSFSNFTNGFNFNQNFSITIDKLPGNNLSPVNHKDFGVIINFRFKF